MDLSTTIIPKSDQLNADDLIAGPRTITVTRVTAGSTAEQPVSIYFEGDNNKPYKPCKSMRRVLVRAWGSDSANYVGKSMKIYREETVKWGGQNVGGIRISHASDITAPIQMALTETKQKRTAFTLQVLEVKSKPSPTPTPSTAPTAAEIEDGRAKLTNAAGHGTEALRTAWGVISKPVQKVLQPELEYFKQKAASSDQPA